MLLIGALLVGVLWIGVAAIVLSLCVVAARGDRIRHAPPARARGTRRFAPARLSA